MPHDVFGEDGSFQVVGNLYGTSGVRPAAGTVLDGIFYVETDTGDVVQAQAGSWVVVDTLTTADVASVFGQTGAVGHTYAGNPNSHVVATFVGDLCVDITNGNLYQAKVADNAHWNIINDAGFSIQASQGRGDIAALFTNNDTDDGPLFLLNSNTLGPQLAVGGIKIFTYAGDPNTHVTAAEIGDLCVDKTNGALYIAQAADDSHWAAL